LGGNVRLSNIKFGVVLPTYTHRGKRFLPLCDHVDYGLVRDVALESEKLGYHSVWVVDHLVFFGGSPILECWTTLSALSSITSRIRLGTLVLCTPFRRPQVLAKMAATLDFISKGRLEFGVGAGIYEGEHLAYGIPFPKPSVRIEQMREAVEIIKRMWTEEKVSYEGKYYMVKDAVCEPKPIQKPHPPITIGGEGEKLLLRVVAEHADRYNWILLPTVEQYKHKLEVLENHCSKVGRNFREIEKSWWGQAFIYRSQKELDRKISQWKPRDVSLEDFQTSNLVGTPEQCLEKIERYADVGVTCFMLMFGDLPSMEGLRLSADEVAGEIAKRS